MEFIIWLNYSLFRHSTVNFRVLINKLVCKRRTRLSNVYPLECKGNYSATSNNLKLVHWPLMGGLLHLAQQGGDWAGPQPPSPSSLYQM